MAAPSSPLPASPPPVSNLMASAFRDELAVLSQQRLSPQERERAQALSGQIDILRSISVTEFGLSVFDAQNEAADELLKKAFTQDNRAIGSMLGKLIGTIENTPTLPSEGPSHKQRSWVMRALGRARSQYDEMVGKCRTLADELEKLSSSFLDMVEKQKEDAGVVQAHLDNLRQASVETSIHLQAAILAYTKWESKRAKLEERVRDRVAGAQEDLARYDQNMRLLQDKIISLRTNLTAIATNGDNFRTIQENAITLLTQIREALTSDIPALRTQMTMSLTVENQTVAVNGLNSLREMTRKLQVQNATKLGKLTEDLALSNRSRYTNQITTYEQVNKIRTEVESRIRALHQNNENNFIESISRLRQIDEANKEAALGRPVSAGQATQPTQGGISLAELEEL